MGGYNERNEGSLGGDFRFGLMHLGDPTRKRQFSTRWPHHRRPVFPWISAEGAAWASVPSSGGLSYVRVTSKFEEHDSYDDYSRSEIVRLVMPKVGGRWYGAPVGNLKHYAVAEAFYVIPFVSGERDGKKLTSEEKKELRDLFDIFGLSLGYGSEYYFSNQFSVGGELLMNWAYWDYDEDDDDWSYESSLFLGATLARATFNFYFK